MSWRLALGLAFGAGFLAFAFWGVPLGELAGVLADAAPLPLAAAAVLFLVQQALRALRQLLLVKPVASNARFCTQHAIICMGFFCINTFPARLGEFVRPYLLREMEGVPLGAGVGLVLGERLLDLIAVLVALLAVLVWVDLPPEGAGRAPALAELGRRLALLMLPPLLAMLLALILWGPTAIAWLARLVNALKRRAHAGWLAWIGGTLLRFAASVVDGLAALRRPGHLAGILALTAAIILLSAGAGVCIARSVGLEALVGFGEALGIVAVTSLGIALPAPPAQAGVFEGSVRAGLGLFGISGEAVAARGLAFALLGHWWIFAVQAATAAWYFTRERGRLRGILAQVRAPAHSREAS